MQSCFVLVQFCLVLATSVMSCKSTATVIQGKNNTMISFEYLDGSANRYRITPDSIVYDPVTPQESSSGLYSGGEPYHAAITTEAFARLQALFEKAITVTADQTTERSKGTGVLVLSDKRRFIFKMGSGTKSELEAAIRTAAGKK